ncbi:CbtA family protein [soil metagenome]
MTRDLLWRGMLAGIVAALFATLFARIFAEPQVDLAIAFEAAQSAHAMAVHAAEEPELVSRTTQKGLGLLTATSLYGAAVGGIFSLVFAYSYGRLAIVGPRTLALLLGALAFLVIVIVPALKYPPTPPAVGLHETVGLRTIAYFAMIALSVVACIVAVKLRSAVAARVCAFNALLCASVGFVTVIAVAQMGLPAIDEVPAGFPPTVLWDFRVASLGMQLTLWTTLALVFGVLAEGVVREGFKAPFAQSGGAWPKR